MAVLVAAIFSAVLLGKRTPSADDELARAA
jgi:hypothetical protein